MNQRLSTRIFTVTRTLHPKREKFWRLICDRSGSHGGPDFDLLLRQVGEVVDRRPRRHRTGNLPHHGREHSAGGASCFRLLRDVTVRATNRFLCTRKFGARSRLTSFLSAYGLDSNEILIGSNGRARRRQPYSRKKCSAHQHSQTCKPVCDVCMAAPPANRCRVFRAIFDPFAGCVLIPPGIADIPHPPELNSMTWALCGPSASFWRTQTSFHVTVICDR